MSMMEGAMFSSVAVDSWTAHVNACFSDAYKIGV